MMEEGVKKETGKEKGTLENDKRVKVKYAEIRNSFANDIQKGERKIKSRKGDLGMGGREVTEQIRRRRRCFNAHLVYISASIFFPLVLHYLVLPSIYVSSIHVFLVFLFTSTSVIVYFLP